MDKMYSTSNSNALTSPFSNHFIRTEAFQSRQIPQSNNFFPQQLIYSSKNMPVNNAFSSRVVSQQSQINPYFSKVIENSVVYPQQVQNTYQVLPPQLINSTINRTVQNVSHSQAASQDESFYSIYCPVCHC